MDVPILLNCWRISVFSLPYLNDHQCGKWWIMVMIRHQDSYLNIFQICSGSKWGNSYHFCTYISVAQIWWCIFGQCSLHRVLTLEPSSLGSRCDLVPYERWMVPTYHTWMQARLKAVKNQGITVNAERSSEPNRNTRRNFRHWLL